MLQSIGLIKIHCALACRAAPRFARSPWWRHANQAGWLWFVVGLPLFLPAATARAQTDPRTVVANWLSPETWGMTNDDLLYQRKGHLEQQGPNAQIFWWDSQGRFRLRTHDADAPLIGYRWATTDFGFKSHAQPPVVPRHLDEVSLAAALHLGEVAGGRVWCLFGAGWSGNHLFSDPGGIFGIGHLLWQKPMNDDDLLVISLDYNGVRSYLPNVPLPGFELIHRAGDKNWLQIGFPRSAVNWEPLPGFTIEAAYEMPYTANVTLAYELGAGWSVFGRGANFFNAYRLDDEPSSRRVFFQMARAGLGVRYLNPHLVFEWAYFDFSLSAGYAFEQRLSTGYDIRDLDRLARFADAPYIGLLVRGSF